VVVSPPPKKLISELKNGEIWCILGAIFYILVTMATSEGLRAASSTAQFLQSEGPGIFQLPCNSNTDKREGRPARRPN